MKIRIEITQRDVGRVAKRVLRDLRHGFRALARPEWFEWLSKLMTWAAGGGKGPYPLPDAYPFKETKNEIPPHAFVPAGGHAPSLCLRCLTLQDNEYHVCLKWAGAGSEPEISDDRDVCHLPFGHGGKHMTDAQVAAEVAAAAAPKATDAPAQTGL